jgi:hypothetical protein
MASGATMHHAATATAQTAWAQRSRLRSSHH